jgi:hypothetical protein
MDIKRYFDPLLCKVCWKEQGTDAPCPGCGLASHYRTCSDNGFVGVDLMSSRRRKHPLIPWRVEGDSCGADESAICNDCAQGDA